MFRTDMIDAIGRTPVVQLKRDPQAAVAVYGKLELLNPFGMKDRVAKRCILEAKRTGLLRDGAPIIESSSGTMALGVALVGTYLGHDVHIVTDPRIDPMTMAKLQAIGCQVHVVDYMTEQGWQGARLERLNQLLEQHPGAFWPRQYENPDNPAAYQELANELVEDIGQIDILVGSVGSGGSLCGTARTLRAMQPNLRVVAVDAVGSVIFGQPDRPGRLQSGLGNSLIPPNVDLSVIDEIHWLSDSEAFSATIELARVEKIFAGNSSGSAYAIARWLSRHAEPDTNIVALFPDRGDRYFSTIYSQDYHSQKAVTIGPLPDAPQLVPYGALVDSWSYAMLNVQHVCPTERPTHAELAPIY